LGRRWQQDSDATFVQFSSGEVLTELRLRAIDDSIFGTADFPTDAVGPIEPHLRVTGHRIACV
jgi:hypothetical protein